MPKKVDAAQMKEAIGSGGPGRNFPGFGYSQRVVTAWGNALTGIAENYNDSWNQIIQGTYGCGSWMRTVATTYETLFDAAAEVLKGPSFRSRPEWLHFSVSANIPNSLSGVLSLDHALGPHVRLVCTPFERLGQGKGKDADLWKHVDWTDAQRRDSITVVLDQDVVATLGAGHYLGFVLANGVTGEPPLGIVMLQVTT
jgi:hypothetical protein